MTHQPPAPHLRAVPGGKGSAPPNRSEVHSLRTFPKNRKGEEVRVSVESFNGHRLLNVRVWFPGEDGQMRPGKQGLALKVELLPELRQALDLMAEAEGMGDAL